MTDAADWTRPHWTRDEARALLVFFAFGAFAAEPRLDLSAHGSTGLPSGAEMRRIPKAQLAHWEGNPLRGALAEILREANPAAFEAARKAPECLLVRAELADAESLDYLRDTLGIVAALLDAGAVAIVDPQILEIFSAQDWQARYAGAGLSQPRRHALVLCQDEADGSAWVKTRGMRKFARPDISIRRVPRADVARAGEVAAQLVDLQARGMRFGDGSSVHVEGLPADLVVARAGSLDDPEFNNTHLALDWPAA